MTDANFDGTEDYNARCMREDSDRARARRKAIDAYNRRTAKLIPNGDASRDKLVSERLNLRQGER